MTTRRWLHGLCAAAALWPMCAASPAAADAPEVRFARQFSMGYLQFNMMQLHKLLEKHAKEAGIPDVKVTWATFNGPNAMNDALLSNSVDIVAGGVPGLVTLWAKTKGTPLAVKGIAAFSSQPILLNTRNPRIKTIADYTNQDKIALPAVKVAVQAILLQMAAAKLWGQENYAKLDPITVSMSPPDSTVALLSGSAGVDSVFSVPPFQQQQLDAGGIHTVLNSFDVMEGPHTMTVAWTSSQFRDRNPPLYKALVKAFAEATDMLNKDPKEAAEGWIADVKSKLPVEKVVEIATGPQVKWTMVPQNTMKFADFMQSVGSIKERPSDWKELFFSEIHNLPGS
jgi:NitT/TauT family transport system substrate-binding protein